MPEKSGPPTEKQLAKSELVVQDTQLEYPSTRMVALSRVQVEAALPRVEPGLKKYCWIQEHLHSCDVSSGRDFQRHFDHFYRVRKNENWRRCFFALMQCAKFSGITFYDALGALRDATGNIEASFASKLVATVDPSKPVIDKFVLEQFKLSLPYPKAKERFTCVLDVYESLSDLYSRLLSSPTGSMILDCFDHRFGSTNLTALKKVDLVLWQLQR
jgi:hypothetical protein